MPDSGHIDRTKINAGLARRGVVTIPTNQVPTAGLLPFPRTFPPHRPLKARAVDVRRCEPPSAATSAGCSPLSTQASLHAVTREVGELPPIASPRPPPPPRSAPRLPRIAYHRSQQSQSQPAGANQCGLIRSPICGFENDGLHWPRRDGLKWPHPASVVVGVDVDGSPGGKPDRGCRAQPRARSARGCARYPRFNRFGAGGVMRVCVLGVRGRDGIASSRCRCR